MFPFSPFIPVSYVLQSALVAAYSRTQYTIVMRKARTISEHAHVRRYMFILVTLLHVLITQRAVLKLTERNRISYIFIVPVFFEEKKHSSYIRNIKILFGSLRVYFVLLKIKFTLVQAMKDQSGE